MASHTDDAHLSFDRTLLAKVKTLLKAMWQSLINLLEVGAKVAGSVSVLVGVAYGAVEYNRTTKNKQVEQTFAYLRRFEESGYLTARQKIDSTFAKSSRQIATAAADSKVLEKTINEIIDRESIQNDVAHVIYFYDELVYCIVSDFCQAKMTYDLFYPKAREYYVNLYSYIAATRRQPTLGHFGAGLETLASFKPAAN